MVDKLWRNCRTIKRQNSASAAAVKKYFDLLTFTAAMCFDFSTKSFCCCGSLYDVKKEIAERIERHKRVSATKQEIVQQGQNRGVGNNICGVVETSRTQQEHTLNLFAAWLTFIVVRRLSILISSCECVVGQVVASLQATCTKVRCVL